MTAQATTYKSIQVAGVVRCNNGGQNVMGVWVNSSLGGSKFATWTPSSTSYPAAANTYAAYTATLSVPWTSTTTSTNVQLRVGCGGNTTTWGSTNRTTAKAVGSSALISATCANPSTATHADSVTCTVASNGSDSGAITSALWALARIKQATTTYTGNGYWSGYCTTFVTRAWAGRIGYQNATSLYNGFRSAGRVPSTSTSIPVGALAFYKLASIYDPKNEGHTNIHVGLGVFVSTKGNVGNMYPIVAYRVSQYADSGHTYLGWMMPPTSWRGR